MYATFLLLVLVLVLRQRQEMLLLLAYWAHSIVHLILEVLSCSCFLSQFCSPRLDMRINRLWWQQRHDHRHLLINCTRRRLLFGCVAFLYGLLLLDWFCTPSAVFVHRGELEEVPNCNYLCGTMAKSGAGRSGRQGGVGVPEGSKNAAVLV